MTKRQEGVAAEMTKREGGPQAVVAANCSGAGSVPCAQGYACAADLELGPQSTTSLNHFKAGSGWQCKA